MAFQRNQVTTPLKQGNPYVFSADLTSAKLISSDQMGAEDRMQQIKNFKLGKPEGYGKAGGKLTPEQIHQMKRAHKVRVTSHENRLPRNSPFAKSATLKDFMKAQLVNNSLFHTEFESTVLEKDSLAQAKELLGEKAVNKLSSKNEEFNKRYYQKYPKWKEKRKREEDIRKKAFAKQCQKLYTSRRQQLADTLENLKRDQMEKKLLGFFDRSKILAGEVPFPPEAFSIHKSKMSNLLEEYRNKLFPHHKLEDFMPPNDITDQDIRNLMEATGRIEKGEKVYEPFVEYLKQKAIYEERFGEWKVKKAAEMKRKRMNELGQVALINQDLLEYGDDQEEGAEFNVNQFSNRFEDSIHKFDGEQGQVELDTALDQESELGDVFMMHSQYTMDGIKKINLAQSTQKRSYLQSEDSQMQQDTIFHTKYDNTSREEPIILAERSIMSFRD